MLEETSTNDSRPMRLPIEEIEKNPENPRIIFRRISLDELKESIRRVGILVPLIVYQKADRSGYVLLDGERRLMCARELGLSTVPVNVIRTPTQLENILRMFNIHRVREQWSTIETALKIERLIDIVKDDTDDELADLTGLSATQIRRYKYILKLPQKGRQLMLDFEKDDKSSGGKASLMEEMIPVLRIVQRDFSQLWNEYDNGERIIDVLIKKYRDGMITNVTQFRLLRKTLLSRKKGVGCDVLVGDLKVFFETEMGIEELYGKVAQAAYDFEAVIKDCERIRKDLQVIDVRALDEVETSRLHESISSLRLSIERVDSHLGEK